MLLWMDVAVVHIRTAADAEPHAPAVEGDGVAVRLPVSLPRV